MGGQKTPKYLIESSRLQKSERPLWHSWFAKNRVRLIGQKALPFGDYMACWKAKEYNKPEDVFTIDGDRYIYCNPTISVAIKQDIYNFCNDYSVAWLKERTERRLIAAQGTIDRLIFLVQYNSAFTKNDNLSAWKESIAHYEHRCKYWKGRKGPQYHGNNLIAWLNALENLSGIEIEVWFCEKEKTAEQICRFLQI